MANNHTGHTQPEISQEEHDHKNLSVKKVGLTGYKSSTDEYIRIGSDSDGNLSVATANVLVPEPHDYISLSQTATVDTWTYKDGGSGGTTVATVTVTFTDSGKTTISTVART